MTVLIPQLLSARLLTAMFTPPSFCPRHSSSTLTTNSDTLQTRLNGLQSDWPVPRVTRVKIIIYIILCISLFNAWPCRSRFFRFVFQCLTMHNRCRVIIIMMKCNSFFTVLWQPFITPRRSMPQLRLFPRHATDSVFVTRSAFVRDTWPIYQSECTWRTVWRTLSRIIFCIHNYLSDQIDKFLI